MELILEKNCFFSFLGADFLAPKSGQRLEKQPVLGPGYRYIRRIDKDNLKVYIMFCLYLYLYMHPM